MTHLGAETIAGRSARLALAMAGLWLVAVVPAVKAFGSDGLAALSFSTIVCFIPGCMVFWLVATAPPAAAQIRAVLWGTGLRMLCALGGAWVMQRALAIAPANYLIWLGLCYLIALGVETCLVLPRRQQPHAG